MLPFCATVARRALMLSAAKLRLIDRSAAHPVA
jgi:hypothetical protein